MADPVYLDDLEDVSVPDPADGDVLYWDEAASLWKCKALVPVFDSLERLITQSSDDVHRETGFADVLDLTKTWNRAGANLWAGNQYYAACGLGWANITIPKGAHIITAKLTLTAKESLTATTVNTIFKGEAADNPVTFTTKENYDTRPRTDASVEWHNIPGWSAENEYISPELKSIFQEIVNRPAWESGNRVVLFWHNDGSSLGVSNCFRAPYAWDGSPPKSPKLYVAWITW